MRVRIDETGRPTEVLGLDIGRREAHLDTVRLHRGDVTQLLEDTVRTVCGGHTDQVVVVTGVDIHREVDTVVEETGLQAEVELVLLFIRQVGVGCLADIEARLAVLGEVAPRCGASDDGLGISDRRTVCRE